MSHLKVNKKVFAEDEEKLMRSFSRLFRFHSCLPSHLRSLLSLGGANSHHGDWSHYILTILRPPQLNLTLTLHCFALFPGGLLPSSLCHFPASQPQRRKHENEEKGEVSSVLKTLTSVWPTGLLILKLWKVVMRFKSIFSSKVLLLSQTFTLCSFEPKRIKISVN